MHSRFHVEIMHLLSPRWPGGRSRLTEGAGSVHQRPGEDVLRRPFETGAAEAVNRPGLGRPTRRGGGTRTRRRQTEEAGTGSRLLHYFSTTRVDSGGLRWNPVDSMAADKRLTLNVLDHKLRIVSQLQKHARTGSTPAAFTAIEPCSPSRIRPVGRKSRNPPEPISTGRRRGPTSGIRVRARVRSAAALPRRRARVFRPAVIRPVPGSVGSVTRFFLRNQRPCR